MDFVNRANAVDPKRPSEAKAYSRDWSGELGTGATITISTWAITPTGLSSAPQTTVGAVTTTLLSGGIQDTDYQVANTIVTSDGETLEKCGVVQVRL